MCKESLTEIRALTKLLKQPAAVSIVESGALLAAWRKYSENPHSNHAYENFKAGWVAANIFAKGEDREAIKHRVRILCN